MFSACLSVGSMGYPLLFVVWGRFIFVSIRFCPFSRYYLKKKVLNNIRTKLNSTTNDYRLKYCPSNNFMYVSIKYSVINFLPGNQKKKQN